MAIGRDFLQALHDVFAGLGPVRSRPMSGGCGASEASSMFALVADDGEVDLKSDAETTRRHEEGESKLFRYAMRSPVGDSVLLSCSCGYPQETARRPWTLALALRARTKAVGCLRGKWPCWSCQKL